MSLLSYLEENLLVCSWKETIGINCLGCGMQRAIVLILKGDFIEAFKMYPAIYSLFFMFIYLGLHLKFEFKKGSKILLYLFIINIAIMITNYIIKFNN